MSNYSKNTIFLYRGITLKFIFKAYYTKNLFYKKVTLIFYAKILIKVINKKFIAISI